MIKKVITVVVFIVVFAIYAQTPVAKTSKAMKQYGPVSLNVARIGEARFGKEVIEITADSDKRMFTLVKLGADGGVGDKNKTTGPSEIPTPYTEKGGAQLTWADGITFTNIIGFKSKTVFVQYTMTAGGTRIYAYQIGTYSKPCKVLGSTSNIAAIDWIGNVSTDGKSLWLEAANTVGRGNANTFVMLFDKKLNGLYDVGGKGKNKVYNAKTEFEVKAGSPVTLPSSKDQYTGVVNGADISTYK